jgi:hypothetical protein
VRIGLPVRATFVQVDDDLNPFALPAWRLAEGMLPDRVIDVTPTFVISSALATRDFQDVHHDRDRAVARGRSVTAGRSVRLVLQTNRELAVLDSKDDAELHVGHAVALDPVVEPPALVRTEFPGRVQIPEEPEDADLAVAADPDVANESGFLLSGCY